MPTPARTSLDEIVAAGRELIETRGLEALTMKELASLVGVRAPSLYKHVSGRGEVIRRVIESAVADLGRLLESAVGEARPGQCLPALAHAFRAFAHSRPESYRLIFAPLPEDWQPRPEVMLAAVGPVLSTTETMVGPDRALEAARLVTAWGHGFMTMELAGAFRMEGDIEVAFDYGIERIGAALSGDAARGSHRSG